MGFSLFGKKEDYKEALKYTPSYYVYIIECEDGSYYTGFTENLHNRIIDHKMNNGSKYTKDKGFKRVVYFESHSNKSWALQREQQIKSAGRIYRQNLVREFQKNLMLIR